LEWELAAVPLDKLPSVLSREREFSGILRDETGDRLWSKEGTFQRPTSEPLIPVLGLAVIASGRVPAASGDKEVLREIAWKPEDPAALVGPKLLEVTGRDSQGRIIGNRALIYFGEVALTRKVTKTQSIVRAARLTNGDAMKKSTISVLDKDLKENIGGEHHETVKNDYMLKAKRILINADDEIVFLRVERRQKKIVGLLSRNGTSWEKLGELSLETAGPVKVGVAAVNNSLDAFSPEFSDFRFFEAKKSTYKQSDFGIAAGGPVRIRGLRRPRTHLEPEPGPALHPHLRLRARGQPGDPGS
jgi:hypothetical protein